jgi:hypothetical protein
MDKRGVPSSAVILRITGFPDFVHRAELCFGNLIRFRNVLLYSYLFRILDNGQSTETR